MTAARLQVSQLQTPQLGPIDLSLAGGETLAVHGPSGAGKTLLLRAITDLDPNTGEAWVDGTPRSSLTPADWRRQVMLVPAESHWWGQTVREHADDWPAALLSGVGFDGAVLDWEVRRLSSGERQRLALVRALACCPAVLLLDEVTANLDPENTARAEAVIRDFQRRSDAAILWVSHDPAQRQRVATRHAELRAGQLTAEAS